MSLSACSGMPVRAAVASMCSMTFLPNAVSPGSSIGYLPSKQAVHSRDAGCSVDVRSDVALVGDVRRPGVDPHAHADRSRRKHLLCFGSSGNRGRRGGEREKERVALRIHLDTVVANERLTQGAAMLRQGICVCTGTQLLQEPRRALNVGEDEGDGSGRKLACHAAIQARRATRCRGADASPARISLRAPRTGGGTRPRAAETRGSAGSGRRHPGSRSPS